MTAQTPPPGICQRCGIAVPVDEIYRKNDGAGNETGPRLHRVRARKHDVIGDPCGPVQTIWIYRMVVWVQLGFFPGQMTTLVTQRPRPVSEVRDFFVMAAEVGRTYEKAWPRLLRVLRWFRIVLDVHVISAMPMGGE